MRPRLVCDRVREQVSLQLDNGLSELERRMLEWHLGRCAECREYAVDVRAFTLELRSAPLERLERPIVVPGGRRFGTGRLQVGAAAAVAIAALGIASQLASEPDGSSFSRSAGTMTRFPTQVELDRELAIFENLPERSLIGPAGGIVL